MLSEEAKIFFHAQERGEAIHCGHVLAATMWKLLWYYSSVSGTVGWNHSYYYASFGDFYEQLYLRSLIKTQNDHVYVHVKRLIRSRNTNTLLCIHRTTSKKLEKTHSAQWIILLYLFDLCE